MNKKASPRSASLTPTAISRPSSKKSGRSRMGAALLIAVAGVLPAANLTAAGNWGNFETTWPPGASQNWALNENWIEGVAPGPSDIVNMGTVGTALIDSDISISRLYFENEDSDTCDRGIWIADGGSLAVSANFEIANGAGSQEIYIAAGGSLTGTNIKFGLSSPSSPSGTAILTNSGSISAASLDVAKGAEFFMKGGTFTTSAITTLGATNSTNVHEGKLIQTGGAITVPTLQLNAGGTYEISGGSIDATTQLYIAYANTTPRTLGGTLHVIGSAASEIKFNGLRYFNDDDRAKMTWAFTLDNSANHLTKTQFLTNGNEGGKIRDGTLDVGLNGGVMLSGTNETTLMEAPDILESSNFANAADYEGDTAKLWTQILVDDTPATLLVSLTDSALKGTLDGTGTKVTTFTAANYGYLYLTNISPTAPITISLDIMGGTLSKFTDALTRAGIAWAAGSGDYELILTLDPSISGGNYFAWDLADIDGAMGIQGAMVAAIRPK